MSFLPKILLDAHDYRESVITCLRMFERDGGIITYDEDTDPEDHDRFDDKTRTQSAYRTFQELCTLPTLLHNAQMYAYNLYRDDLPTDSTWATALKDISTPSPFSPTLDHEVLHPNVFYKYLSRVWRTLSPDTKRVFYAVSAIRALAVGARWVEYLWDLDHPQAQEIRDEIIRPCDARTHEENFGILKLTGPYTTRSLKRMGVRSNPGDSTLDIPGWNLPVFSQTYTFNQHARTIFFSDTFYNIFYWIYLPKDYFQAILPLLTAQPTTQTPRTPSPRLTQRTRIPHAPITDRTRYNQDLLESVAARLGSDYSPLDMYITIANLQMEGFVPNTIAAARAFELQYRNHLEI